MDSFEASFIKSIFDETFSFILFGDKDGIIADQPDSVLSLSNALMKISISLNSSASRSGSVFTSFGKVFDGTAQFLFLLLRRFFVGGGVAVLPGTGADFVTLAEGIFKGIV